MRKKYFLLFIIILSIVIVTVSREKKQTSKKQNSYSLSISPSPKASSVSRSVFVPYWASEVSGEDFSYDSYYYFGIRPTKEGSIENEAGYQKMFLVSALAEKQKKLVLRMLDSSVTEVLLQDKNAQKMLVSSVKSILSKNVFSGIILDIEVPFTLQANKREQITKFVQLICTAIKTDYKTCGMLIYGDFSYRNRPYDLKALGEVADTILLMAYDFHKPGGEPGPNFPFDRRSSKSEGGFDYGYDFKTMIQDAVSFIPKDKIEVVFGMYGYDWTLNEQKTSLKTAKTLSLKEIKIKLQSPSFAKATEGKQNSNSKEKSIQYIDEEGKTHVIWYENEESVAVKTKYLEGQGIWRTSFWARSYF